nr:hypothetical protein B0A51_01090 [Rachicladosporium sp. CCFEE 5018]
MQCLQSLYLDQPIVVKIIVIPSADCPDFTAKIRVDIDLESFTEIHAGNTLGRSRKGCLREEYRVAGYDHQPGSGQRLEPLSNTNEYSTTATSKSISGIASTFFTRSMSRWYTLRIRIMFDSSEYYNNGNELLGYHSFPVVLMPPVAGSASAETVLRPFGRRYWLFDHMYEKPTMTNRFSVPSGNAVLPKYEQPPSYDTLSKEKAGGGAPDTKPTKGKTSKHD